MRCSRNGRRDHVRRKLAGEDVGCTRAFKTSNGLLGGFGWERVIGLHPSARAALSIGAACGMRLTGAAAHCRDAVHRFQRFALQPDYEFRRQGTLPVECPGAMVFAPGQSGGAWHGGAVPRVELPDGLRASHRTESDVSLDERVRWKGLLKGRGCWDNNPVALLRTASSSTPDQRRGSRRRLHPADRQSLVPAPLGKQPDDPFLRAMSSYFAEARGRCLWRKKG